MKINTFISSRKEKWKGYENILIDLEKKNVNYLSKGKLREFALLYRALSTDLAYVKTYYPKYDLKEYLNGLVTRGYTFLHGRKRTKAKDIWEFYVKDFPRTFRKEKKYFFMALAVFLAAGIIAYILTILNENFARYFVSGGIIEHIKQNKMWTDNIGVIFPSSIVSAQILTNNITVTFIAFAYGIMFGIGTAYILVINGINLGVVIALTTIYGMNNKLFNFIVAHGILEISIILIASAAGLIIGEALIDPKNLKRSDNLKLRGKSAIKLILGGIPFLILCGFIEGYISPSILYPPAFKYFVGISLGIIFYLFLLLNHKGENDE
ncbi:stage II sporulation protein M [bacterium]|nr:stage II sporulation protein M [bacterium]